METTTKKNNKIIISVLVLVLIIAGTLYYRSKNPAKEGTNFNNLTPYQILNLVEKSVSTKFPNVIASTPAAIKLPEDVASIIPKDIKADIMQITFEDNSKGWQVTYDFNGSVKDAAGYYINNSKFYTVETRSYKWAAYIVVFSNETHLFKASIEKLDSFTSSKVSILVKDK